MNNPLRVVPIVLDLETEPDLAWLDESGRAFAESLEAPANYKKAESISKWIEEQAAKRIEKAATSPIDGRITAAAVAPLWGDAEPIAVVNRVSERTLLVDLVVAIGSILHSAGSGQPVFAGYNIADFDLPFLAARAAVHRVRLPEWWPDLTRRFGVCLDAFDVLGREGKLELWLARMKLPAKNGSGAVIHTMTDDQLRDYVANDVRVERELLRRLADVSPLIRSSQPATPQ